MWQELLRGVTRSMWEAICEVEQRRGLSFTWNPDDPSPDPLGVITMTADPSMPHESATRHLEHELLSFLSFLGLMGMVSIRGSASYDFGPGRKKEPDASYQFCRESPCEPVSRLLLQCTQLLSRRLLSEPCAPHGLALQRTTARKTPQL